MAELPDAEPYRLADSPSHLLHRAEQLAADRFAQLVGEAITLRQFAVLAAIAECPGLSQSRLVRATGVDRSTLAEMLNRMERNGWVARADSDSDARAYAVRLAPDGARVLRTTTQHARAADAAILDLLPKGKRKAFLSTLAKLSKLSDAAAEKAERQAGRRAKRETQERARVKQTRKLRQRAEQL